ncbi:Protein rad9 [Metarhizium anisopliae]|nr:Protein rad9 [Metarhizium anisopliae]
MAHYNTNGPKNGVKSVEGPREQNGVSRPFTLQESLPYSPQTSTLDIIPDPSVGSGSPSLRISDLFSTQDYDRVNQEATSQPHGAKNLKQTVDHVLHDLKPSKRTQYKFPTVPNGAPSSSAASTHNRSISQGLSPIAKAVYERVGSFFKATKPNISSPKLVNGEAEQPLKLAADSVSQSPTIHVQPQSTAKNNAGSGKTKMEVAISTTQSFDRSQYAEISYDHPDQNIITPHDQLIVEAQQYSQSNPLTAKSSIVVNNAGLLIELPTSGIKREDYQEFKVAPDAPENLSFRRKERQEFEDGQDIIGASLDQRQRGEAALDSLDALMRQVFSAVGGALVMEPGLEHIVTLTADQEASMTATTQQKMHTAIQKVIGLRSFNAVPLENLLRVMKLSEASLKQAEGLDIRVDESWDEAAVESWVQQLGELQTALKSARTCLRIMSGCREDKQLYSEAVITKCVNIYKAVTEDIVMPLVELRNSGSSGGLFKLIQKHKKTIASVFVCCQKLSALLAELITKIELQFKLADGGSIQPVSALIMRLVQASSGRVGGGNGAGQGSNIRAMDIDGLGEDDEDDRPLKRNQATATILNEEQGAQQPAVAIQELEGVAAPLIDTAARNASYVINFIVKRAMGSTKSGDTPYRNLLDLFVDDFTTCLDLPDWPSAELLLRLLMVMMVQLFEAPKTAAPAKNMALELLGTMSAAISRLRSHVKKSAGAFISSDAGKYSQYLSDLATHCLEQRCPMENIIAWAGPYRGVLEYLQERSSEDPHLSSAVSFLISDWATRVHTTYDNIQDNDSEGDKELGRSAFRLRMMIEDRQWLASEYTFKAVTTSQARFAFSVILLRSPFCESFGKILNILLGSMASDQATVRSKSLKSVNQVLETDPSILDGDSTVIQLILDCASDSSTQVRDSALGLLGSCISMRPVLEASLTPKIIDRFQDAGVGVRKRAMKLARDIYLRNRGKNLRSAIANGLLRRIQDPDEGVRDLARQMIEEVWFAPFYTNENTASFETSLAEHVSLVIQTVKGGTVTEILDKVLQTILKPGSKSLDGPFGVCSRLVGIMFGLIDNPESEDPTVPSGRDALQVLTIFAKADPNLFNFEQIKLLKTQLASFTGADELAAFRAVTVIYKRVLPQLPNVHTEFLADVRLQLLKGIGKISSRGALDDLIACAHTVCELLKDFAPLGNLVASSLVGIQKLSKVPLDAKRLNLVAAYSIIVGSVGKHCDLDKQARIFREKFPGWKGDSVPKLIVDILSPFSSPQQPLDARKASIEAIGLVCQSWPRNYDLVKVYTAFQQVFQDKIPILETMILRSFKEFLVTEERRSEAAAEAPKEKNKELTVMGGTNFDDVASGATQRFLKEITRIALSSQDEHAFLAMEVLGSINRQGLTHPKETGVTLITLETSANRKIAELAYLEHRSLHEKHETVLEREYVKAVQSAYNYQRDIVKDSHGATMEPFQSKLHLLMEVLKISKMKNRQRFLEKFPDVPPPAVPVPTLSVEPQRLRQLTAGSIILLSLWEVRTHLRRLFGMGTNRHDNRAKALAKDLNKTPLKVQGVHGERVWDEIVSHMNGLSSQESMVHKCKAFVELMNVDKEFKVAEEDDEMGMGGGPSTPSEGEDDDDGGDRGRKRKAAGTPGGRKKRARSGSQTRKRGRPRKQSVEQSDDGDFDGDWI